ncbi:MAG: sigma-70 family RNA polymerase sigma factor [Planctomycetes bacterium]|nr:sigma-70 family RNA polymerase sigma factor [Planctomycetota bacterium]
MTSWNVFTHQPSEENFLPVYESTKRLVWTLCLRKLGDHVDASDAFQSVYCRLLALARQSKLPDGADADTASEIVCRIARREADSLRKRRARRRAREVPLDRTAMSDRKPAMEESIESKMARQEIRARVETLVQNLPEHFRLPVLLHYFHGLSQREIARSLGEPLSTISDRLRKALQKLDPAFRREGLGGAAMVLLGLSAGGALIEPSLSAAEVYALAAKAAAAMAGAAALKTSTSISTPIVLGGIAIMKAKLAVAAGAILLALAGFFFFKKIHQPVQPAGPAPATLAVKEETAGAPIADKAAASSKGPRGTDRDLEVLVVWSDTGEPASGAKVRLGRGIGSRSPAVENESGADGKTIFKVPADAAMVWLEALHAEGSSDAVSVQLPIRQAATVQLHRDVIGGLVTDAQSGEPIPQAHVRCGEKESLSDESGSYILRGLGPGTHTLKASAAGYAPRPAQVSHSGRGRSRQDFSLDPAGAVIFQIVDEAGAPLPGALATPAQFGYDGSFFLDDGVAADASGQARLAGISRLHPPEIQVSREGYRSASLRPKLSLGEESVEIKIVLERIRIKQRAIIGRVTDAAARPIQGAIIHWKDAQGTRYAEGEVYDRFRAVTDGNGNYRLDFPDESDRCHLGVAARGFAPVVARNIKPGSPAEPAVQNFTLEVGHWLKGRILDEVGKPLPGARIQAMPKPELLNEGIAYPHVLRQAEADASGMFQLEDLAGPSVAILLTGGDGPGQEESIEVELVFKSWGVIRGRVLDGESNQPISTFTVRISRCSGDLERFIPGESFTSPEGRFVLKRLDRSGNCSLVVETEGYLPAEINDRAPRPEAPLDAPAEELAVNLQRGRAVDGAIVDAATGQPLAGIQVAYVRPERARDYFAWDWEGLKHMADFRTTITASDGAFHLLEGDSVTLLVRGQGRERLFIPPEGRRSFRQPDGKLRIPLERGEVLSGICWENGRAAAGATIRLGRSLKKIEGKGGEEDFGFTRTDADGRFRWDDLSSGAYILETIQKLAEPRPDFQVKRRWRIEVQAGVETRIEVGNDLGSHLLRGRIAGMEGRESLWANLHLQEVAENGSPEFFLTTYRDWDWRFACPSLRPGKYGIEVEFYTKSGNRKLILPPLEISGDQEVEFQVPADDR